MAEESQWHWRNSMKPVRFFNIDARAAIPWLLMLIYFRWITFFISISVTTILLIVEKKGLVLPSALRAVRVWFLGPVRPSVIGIHKRKFIDYGL